MRNASPSFGPPGMRLNEDVVLLGQLAALVPYSTRHVPRYYQWMKSEELLKLTASEPLTLEQEYQMQRSWQEDDDKCTFIVLDKMKWESGLCTEEDCMVGDVNLFFTDPEDLTVAEIEVMIAEPSFRGKGFGKEVTMLMMYFGTSLNPGEYYFHPKPKTIDHKFQGVTKLRITKFQAKISLENPISIAMFRNLHFEEVSISDVFQEMTLWLIVDDCRKKWLLEQMNRVKQDRYSETKQRLEGIQENLQEAFE